MKLGSSDCTFQQLRIDDPPLYNQDDDRNQAEPVQRLKREVLASHGVMFVTAEYNRSGPSNATAPGITWRDASVASHPTPPAPRSLVPGERDFSPAASSHGSAAS